MFAAIFDWDGVVVDSSVHHERSWELLAEEEGRELPPGHFKKGFGQKNERIIPDILHWTDDLEEIHRLSLRKEALYREVLGTDSLVVLPGAMELLSSLQQQRVPCAIGSSTHLANLRTAFGLSSLGDYFSVVVSGEDVSHGKPDPEVFLIAAQRLGYSPERCVVFEDVPAGVAAARSGGMKVVALTTTNPAHMLTEADLVVGTLADVSVGQIRALFETPGE